MAKIVAIRYAGIKPVYNMEVYGLHNYVTPQGTVLHNCRYFCVSRVQAAMAKKAEEDSYWDEDETESYETALCGGDPTAAYIGA